MLPPSELPPVLSGLGFASADRTYSRRIELAALLGVSPYDTTGAKVTYTPGAKTLLTFPNFFYFTNKPYRFNPAGISTLYIGEKETTISGEVKQDPGLNGFDVQPASPQVIFHVFVKVSRLLDVTNASIQSDLKTTSAELVAPWRPTSPISPTQVLGDAVHKSSRFEGIRYQSAPMLLEGRDEFCIVLFPDRLQPSSEIRVFDPGRAFDQKLWP